MSILKLKDSQGNWVGVPTIKGAKGDNGNGISSAVLNNDYTLTLTFTDGITYTTPSIRGEKGEKGEPATDMDIHICSASEYDSETRVPTISDPNDKTFYLVPTEDGTSPDLFTEWVYVNDAWEMFGSASVDLTDYVKNTDYASANTGGVVKVDVFTNDYQGGIATIDNKLNIIGSSATDVKRGLYYNKPVSVANQHESTFYGLAKVAGHDEKDSTLPVGQYTNEAKSSIQDMLDVPSTSELKEVNDSKADVIVESASGDIVSFDDGADDMPLKSLVVDINPIQDLNGYDSPWVGGGGKNLLDPTLLKDIEAWNIIPIKVKPSTAYTASTDKPSLSAMPAYFTTNNTGGGGTVNNLYINHPVTITSTEDGYVYFSQRRASGEDSFTNYHFQVEEGSTATDWTPYENICPINGWTAMNVVRTGKNLFDKNSYLSYRGYFDSSEIVSNVGHVIVYIRCMPNTTYTVSRQRTVTNERFAVSWTKVVPSSHVTIYDKKSSTNAGTVGDWMSLTITTGEDAKYLAVWAWWNSSVDPSDTLQIEYSDTRTEYEPFGRTINVNWETETGTVYGGKLDVLTGIMTVNRVMATFDGSSDENWSYYSIATGNLFRTRLDDRKQGEINSSIPDIESYKCNAYKVAVNSLSRINGTFSGSVKNVDFVNNEYSTLAEWRQYLSENNIQFVYPLAEPTEIQLTPHEVNSLLGVNNIWADTGTTSVEYCADTEMYIEKVKPIVNVDDVQINNTSIVNDGIANIPLATSDTAGVVKVDPYTNAHYGGIASIDNKLFVVGSPFNGIKYGGDYSKPVVAGNQHYSTFYGLAKAAGADEKDSTLAFGTYSDNAKSSIQNMLGITDKYSPKEWVAESETELVTNAHSVGDLFYIGETLYKVIADLNAGDAVNVGVNVEEVNANDILDDYATKEDVENNVNIVEKSASGAVASFDDGMDDIPLKSLMVDINPVQDLHGSDSPWVGGGGRNKFDLDNATLAVGYGGAFRKNGYHDVTVYKTSTGIASDERDTNCGRAVCLGLLSADTYIVSFVNQGDASTTFSVVYTDTNVLPDDGAIERTTVISAQSQSIQFEADGTHYYWLSAYYVSADNYKINDIMLRKSTESDASYAPYENICPISGWTEVQANQSGINLFDKATVVTGYIDDNSGELKTQGLGQNSKATDYISVKPNASYYISSEQTRGAWGAFYDKDKNYISGITGYIATASDTQKTKIAPSNARYMRLTVEYYTNDTIYYGNVDTFSVNYPSTDHDYHPYTGRSITIDLGQTVYGGTLNVLSGKLVIDRAIGVIDNVTAPWSYPTGDWVGASVPKEDMLGGRIDSSSGLACDKMSCINLAMTRWNVYGVSNRLYFTLNRADVGETLESINGWFANNPVQVVYPLATPIEIQLSANQINSILGVNNIFADTGDSAVEYFSQVDKDLIDYIETSLKPYAKEERLNDYVSDVQIDGSSIVTDGVANVPVAGANNLGTVMVANGSHGLQLNAYGRLMISEAVSSNVKSGTNIYNPITPSNQHISTFYGLAKASGDTTQSASSNAVGNYTDEAKDKIQSMLGVSPLIAPHESNPFESNHEIGELFIINSKLYRAKTVLNIGEYVNDGINVEIVDVAEVSNGKLGLNETAHRTASIPMGQVDSTSTSTVFTATIDGITELRDGVCMWLKNGVVDSASGYTININNLGAKPVYGNLAKATRTTTIFNEDYTMLFVYNSTRVEGGCWDIVYGYDSNTNTLGYQIRHNSGTGKASDKTYRYRLLFTGDEDTLVPANTSSSTNATSIRSVNQTPIDPFGAIYYYGSTSTINAGNSFGAASLWQQYGITFGYSFNNTGEALALSYPKAVFVKATPTSDGKAIIDADTPYVQALPTTEDGKIYIYLGQAYSATNVELDLHHPVYEYKNGKIQQYTGNETPTATTTTSGLMSATDKAHLDAVYDDYSSALTALGVI